MVGLARLLVPIALVALTSLAPAAQAAGLKAKTSVTTKSGATRINVKLTSGSRLGDRKRPRKVKVKGGGQTYKLSRVRGASASVVNLGTWRSDAYRGAGARQLLALAGDTVKVIVTSRAGTTTLRSRVSAPAGSTPAPQPDPTPDPTPNTDPQPQGDVTGQAAIDQMTAELRGGFVRDVSSSGSTVYELHMCEDNNARYYSQSIGGGFAFAVEKFGNPWTVADAIFRQDGTATAIVHVTWTSKHDDSGAYEEINESWNTRLDYANGQWYWEDAAVSTGQASCAPTF